MELQVYKNLFIFARYRNIELSTPELSNELFLKTWYQTGQVIISGKRGPRSVKILLLSSSLQSGLKTKDFTKLITNNLIGSSLDMYIITSAPLSKNMKKEILIMKTINKNNDIENYLYKNFVIVIPEHAAVPPHRLATSEEIKILYDVYHVTKNDLQKILISDPPIIWLGAKIGDIIRIDRVSENSGTSVGYRVVTAR